MSNFNCENAWGGMWFESGQMLARYLSRDELVERVLLKIASNMQSCQFLAMGHFRLLLGHFSILKSFKHSDQMR